MRTIQATVNPRLLTKANRLFTGTLDGRVIEILQNARRAGATQVNITNLPDGIVLVRDSVPGSPRSPRAAWASNARGTTGGRLALNWSARSVPRRLWPW